MNAVKRVLSMPLWQFFERKLRDRLDHERFEKVKAAEAAAKEEAERPAYTQEEAQEVRQLWSEPIEEPHIDGKTVTVHINRYIDTRTPEQLKSFARLLLKHGFDLPQQRASQLAEIVAQNKDRFKASFYGNNARDYILKKINAQKKSPERNVTAAVLSNPRQVSTELFEHFFRRPPGGKPFLTPEEFERGKRRGPTA